MTSLKSKKKPIVSDETNTLNKVKSKSKKTDKDIDVEDVYQGMTLHQHVLARPNMYIGSTLVDAVRMFVFDADTNKITEDVINYVGGFFKIFDEILVNARDHTVRDKTCKNIEITIDIETGKITVRNDGNGIPVAVHKKYNIYIPEMIFGNLLTSQNYSKKGKTVGGLNGLGSKVCNIYSKEFEIHTIGVDKIKEVDGKIVPAENAKKVEYKQTFRNNMYDIEKPEINKNISQSAKTFTQISYYPDYEKFGMTGLTRDMYSLLIKRCYDIAACTSKNVNIKLNGEDIKCRKFEDYIKLYYSDNDKPKITYEQVNSRWEIGVAFNKNVGDRYISFVNGISAFQGGTHVNHVVNNIVTKVTAFIKKKKEHKDLNIMPNTIKQYLTFFVNCIIEDPGFNSQTKEYMNSKIADWCTCGNNCPDVKCDISDQFIERLCTSGLMTEVINMSKFKEMRDLDKTDGKKVGNLRSVEKLLDASWAGTRNSHKTSIFFTEGDSAKAFAVAGIGVIGNEKYGVFPLKGKLLNVRKANAKKLRECEEFTLFKQILGLKQGVKYRDVSKLRYGSIIILTDQDPDGSHIRGLIINMLEYFWPELLMIDGFVKAYNTPIVKAWKISDKKRANEKMFYSVPEFEKWRLETNMKLWDYKYYKGLGTSTDKEAKESFYNFEDNLITFIWEKNDEDDQSDPDEFSETKTKLKIKTKDKNQDESNTSNESNLDDESEDFSYMKSKSHIAVCKAFDVEAMRRKEWLQKFNKNDTLEYKPRMKVPYSEFIDKDLIIFSNADNIRSIPSVIDGLKPSQRKILFACIKRGRKGRETKVAQLSGYVAENTDYHQGEQSLQEAIIGLGQNFPGSNNINLLVPSGNFGYRRGGGKDHASPRYIFTMLDPIANSIFREEDDEILDYNDSDGTKIEPEVYAPIIPMTLVNGTSGIGTGWSTGCSPYNPLDIVTNLKRLINDQQPIEMIPWFNGFKGTIEKNAKHDNKYTVKGKYTINGNKVHIEDIPIVNGWIEAYEDKMKLKVSVSKDDNNKLESFEGRPSNNAIDIMLTFKGQELQKMFKDGSLDKYLLMTQNLSETNLVMFNAEGKLTKYDSTNDILREFYEFRLNMYEKRKAYYILKLENDLNISSYKVKFIKEYLAGTIKIAKRSVAQVIEQLEAKKYPKLSTEHRTLEENKSYRYMTDMSLMSLTDDKIKELENNMDKCQALYDEYKNTTSKTLWLRELDEFLVSYENWKVRWDEQITSTNTITPDKNAKTKAKTTAVVTKATKSKTVKAKAVKSVEK